MTTSLRRAPFPVVAAPLGMTLGGGCETMLYADAVQADAELATGLVKLKVGLMPPAGGTTAMLARATMVGGNRAGGAVRCGARGVRFDRLREGGRIGAGSPAARIFARR